MHFQNVDADAVFVAGILGLTDEPLVSMDFKGDSRSTVVDGRSTMIIGDLAKIIAWYDNEWGYSNKVLDMVRVIAG